MKKVLFLVATMAVSTFTSATTIELQGLENIPNATLMDIHPLVYWGNCDYSPTGFQCNSSEMSVKGMPRHAWNIWIQAFNQENQNNQLRKNTTGQDSTITFKFKEYPQECRIVLSDKQHVVATVQADGSCNPA